MSDPIVEVKPERRDPYATLLAAFRTMTQAHAEALAMCAEWNAMYDAMKADRDAARAELAKKEEGK